jgi:hypothetical protein
MEKNTLIIFQTDVKYQLGVITTINQKLVERSENLTSDNPVLLESIAYQIHKNTR